MTTPPDQATVAAILAELRHEVQTAHATRAADPAVQPVARALRHAVEELEITRHVSAHWPLVSNTLLERGVNFANKVVRRGLRWYINPIVEQQNAFNDSATRTVRLLADAYLELLHADPPTAPPATSATPTATPPAGAPLVPPAHMAPAAPTPAVQALIDAHAARVAPALLADQHLPAATAMLATRQPISAHRQFPDATLAEQATALVQRGIRQYLRWYINPIVEQQNAFNAALVRATHTLAEADAAARVAVAARRAQHPTPPGA